MEVFLSWTFHWFLEAVNNRFDDLELISFLEYHDSWIRLLDYLLPSSAFCSSLRKIYLMKDVSNNLV